jgi:predicted RNase H-like nuclease (RuvC/YqgF family)
MADNTRFLAEASHQRRALTLERARQAIRRLDQAGQAVTFCGVAAEAGVSRSWLYREPTIRAEIERLRTARPARPRVPAAQRPSSESLHQRLDAVREEISRLREENRKLREQLARKLGHDRATSHLPPNVSDMSPTLKPLPNNGS